MAPAVVTGEPSAHAAAAAIRNSLIAAAGRKVLAVGQGDFLNPDFVRAAFRAIAVDGDFVAGLDRALGPADAHQVIGAGQLSLPFLGRAGIVLRFPENLDVGIDEVESGDHSLDRNLGARIVIRRAVMREGRNRQRQEGAGYRQCC